MATVYRDYGAVGYNTFPDNEFNVTQRRQVYQATHGGDDLRLPFMNRSFISFSYGTRMNDQGQEERVYIEDFDLIATISGDRMNRAGSASFEDRVSTYEVLNGQKYWGTHYKANTLEFTLSTDGIDQRKLEDFLNWFRPGEAKELILSEHPNRAILARVSEAPQLNLLPFEHDVEFKITTDTYYTKTTLYKGDISLKFVMDDPHWYALDNILGRKENERYANEWKDAQGNWVNIYASQDALKILYEDGIPMGSMIQKNMLLGNGAYASVEGQIISRIWKIYTETDPNTGEHIEVGRGAVVEPDEGADPHTGIIAGPVIDASGNGISELIGGAKGLFYYSGTAPAPTIIRFTLTPELNSGNYIVTPYNSKSSGTTYNTITIESIHKQELKFTIPNLYTSYNKVIDIFNNYINTANTWETVRQVLRDDVRHPRVREWAIKIIDSLKGGDSDIISQPSSKQTAAKTNMSYMLKDGSGLLQPATFEFNSETGQATGTFYYRTVDTSSTVDDWETYRSNDIKQQEEDVGDMLKSNYIILVDRNTPTADGYITEWTSQHPQYSHCIYHNLNVPLEQLSILYKNMYL